MNPKTPPHRTKGLNRFVSVLSAMAILMAGCKSAPKGAAGQSGGGTTYVSSTALPNQMTTAPVGDPSLNNMVASQVTIPEGWKLQGIEMHPPCTPFPSPVFRAFSPDGLMQMRQEPIFAWHWSAGAKGNQNGCANLPGATSAADFLTYYVMTMQGGVHVVGPMPVTGSLAQWAQHMADQGNQNNSHMPPILQLQETADVAGSRVEVVNGSFVIEQRLRAAVVCGTNTTTAPWKPGPSGSCFARVDVLAAPEGKLDALVALADSHDLPAWKDDPQWEQASLQQLSNQNARAGAAMLAQGRAESQAASNRLYSAFQQDMASSAAQHAAFMQQQESSFQSSMNNANAAMNARSTAASDWVDYALDQQTVTGAGGTVKVSSAYSQTWSNGQGQWYQTNLPNANPNGVLPGNWSQTTVVHGNGQPK